MFRAKFPNLCGSLSAQSVQQLLRDFMIMTESSRVNFVALHGVQSIWTDGERKLPLAGGRESGKKSRELDPLDMLIMQRPSGNKKWSITDIR